MLVLILQDRHAGSSFLKAGDVLDLDKTQALSLIAQGAATASVAAPDSSSAPGAVTQTLRKGRVGIAAGQQAVVVSNANVRATSLVFVQVLGADATLQTARVTQGVGSFTVTGNAAATANTAINYEIVD
jgi:hypothetical protein